MYLLILVLHSLLLEFLHYVPTQTSFRMSVWVIRKMLKCEERRKKSERNKEENGRGRMDGQRVDKFLSIRVINRERFLRSKDLGSIYMILHHVAVCQQGINYQFSTIHLMCPYDTQSIFTCSFFTSYSDEKWTTWRSLVPFSLGTSWFG